MWVIETLMLTLETNQKVENSLTNYVGPRNTLADSRNQLESGKLNNWTDFAVFGRWLVVRNIIINPGDFYQFNSFNR